MRMSLVSMVIPSWPFESCEYCGLRKFYLTMKRRRKYLLTQEMLHIKLLKQRRATYYAIALALDRITAQLFLKNEASVLNVSTLLANYHGVSNVYLGVPYCC